MSTNKVQVHVGTPSSDFEDWTTAEVCFHGFADFSTTRGEGVESPLFSCFGHKWKLKLYPGGEEKSNDGYVAVRLSNMSNKSITLVRSACRTTLALVFPPWGFNACGFLWQQIKFRKSKCNKCFQELNLSTRFARKV